MASPIGRSLQGLKNWFGGWSRLLLLVVVVVGVAVGLLWDRERHPNVPPGAAQVVSDLNVDIRQTTFRFPGTIAAVREFYRQDLPGQGWSYCGTQGTPGCSNLIQLVDRPADAIDVYRRPDDQAKQGPTVEIWPIDTNNGQVFVTIYETRSK